MIRPFTQAEITDATEAAIADLEARLAEATERADAFACENESLINENATLEMEAKTATERAEKAEAERDEEHDKYLIENELVAIHTKAHNALRARVAALEGALGDASTALCWAARRLRDAGKTRDAGATDLAAADAALARAAPPAPAPAVSQAAADVMAERRRQIEAEGWTPEHDDAHADGALVSAAYCYETSGDGYYLDHAAVPTIWPWHPDWWKPKDQRRDYVKAHALRQAEIDRLNRLNARLLEKIERLDRAAQAEREG